MVWAAPVSIRASAYRCEVPAAWVSDANVNVHLCQRTLIPIMIAFVTRVAFGGVRLQT